MRVDEARAQRLAAELDTLGVGISIGKLVAHVGDAPTILDEEPRDLVALVDGEDGAFVYLHGDSFEPCFLMRSGAPESVGLYAFHTFGLHSG